MKLQPVKLLAACLLSLLAVRAFAEDTGEQLYMQNCTICHADDGSGAMPGVTDLTINRTWSTLTETQILFRLKQGIQVPGQSIIMPPKGGNPDLTDPDLLTIISFMRKEFIK